MKNYFKRIISAVMSAALCLQCGIMNSSAAEETPSGIAVTDIQSAIEEHVKDIPYSSFAVSVFHGDETVYTGYYGEIDRNNKIAADENSVYEWGSITKTLTWVSVLQLYEQGKIDLNEDIRTYLPEGYLKNLKYDDKITMLNLMNHNAGWCESTYNIFVTDENQLTTLEEMVQDLEPAQIWRPGEVTSYSNYGAALAGLIVERVSGESYIDYVNKHIFDKLGMEQTSVAPDFNDNPWVRTQREKLKAYAVLGDNIMPGGLDMGFIPIYPAGSACGTIEDITKYGKALTDESAPLFENPETQAIIFEGSSFYGDTDTVKCNYGFWPMEHSAMCYGHDGGTLACISNFAFDPESDWGVAVFTNTRTAINITQGLTQLIMGEAETENKAASDDGKMIDLSGIYMPSRANHKGILKVYGLLSVLPVSRIDDDKFGVAGLIDIEYKGNGFYSVKQEGVDGSYIMYPHTLDDGTTIVDMGAMSYIKDDTVIPKIVLFIVFLLMAVVSAVIVFVKFILILAKKRKTYKGSKIISIAQLFKIWAVAAAVPMLISTIGPTKMTGILFAVAAVLCALFAAAAIVSDIMALCSKAENKAKPWRYIFNIIFNSVAIATVLVLEIYQFWGC